MASPDGRPGFEVRLRRPGDPEPDLEHYRLAHRAMELEAEEIAELAGRLAAQAVPYSRRQARALRSYVQIFVNDLRRHCRTEDEIGRPLIEASAAAAGVAVDLTALTDAREEIEPVAAGLAAAVARFAADRVDTAARAGFAASAAGVPDLVRAHAAAVEPLVFPLLTGYVSVHDYQRWEKLADKGVPLRELAQIIPSTARWVDPADLDRLMGKTSPLFRLLLRITRHRFARRYRLIFGADLGDTAAPGG
jgi:hypothetical protein